MKVISNRIIRKLRPCYDPSEVIKDENEELTVKEWVHKYRDLVKGKSDIIWLLCNKRYMSERDMRLFAAWCARETLKLVESPDQRSVEACNVVERYANGEATTEELVTARAASWDAFEAAALAAGGAALAAEAAGGAALAAEAAGGATLAAARATAGNAALAARSAALAAEGAALAAEGAQEDALDAQIDKLMSYFD